MTKPSTETVEIKPSVPLFDFRLKELLHYRYLLYLFIKRDFITNYKQTILGPVWHILQPLLTSLMFTVIFYYFARIKIGNIPPVPFYLSGLTLWVYFAACFNKTSSTFVSNAGIFGKVYFPRFTVPLASVISSLLSLGIQLSMLAVVLIIYRKSISLQWTILLTPLYIAQLAFIGLAFGIIISSLTTRYRDLIYLMNFALQLWMYASPVIYPLALIPAKYQIFEKLNPVCSPIENFKYSLFGQGAFMWHGFIYTSCFTVVLMLAGLMLFNQAERTFMDTV